MFVKSMNADSNLFRKLLHHLESECHSSSHIVESWKVFPATQNEQAQAGYAMVSAGSSRLEE